MKLNGIDEQVKEPKECCSARNVLWYLVFFGFAVNYMIRINLNIAIVAMIQAKPKDDISLTSECLMKNQLVLNKLDGILITSENESTTITSDILFKNNGTSILYTTQSSVENLFRKNLSLTDEKKQRIGSESEEKGFAWDEKIQGYILGSFFWLHWTTQIPGGLLASKYGTKKVFGFSNFAGVLFCFFIPYFAKFGTFSLMGLRLVQGILCGFAWPSMHDMTARWIPPNERSKFVTSYLGSSVGTAMTYPICGFIIDKWGWEYVFYASSAFGTAWFIAWWFLVHDSPTQHPRISKEEKEYILKSLGQSVAKQKAPVPWSDILKNSTVWMNVLAQIGGTWGLFTLMSQAPTYFKFIHGWNIKATGILSGLPHLLRMVWAFVFSLLGDYLLKTNKMSRTNVRKLATAVCCIGQGVFMMALAYSGCHSMAAIVFLTLAVAIHGSVSTGPLASVVDISPNYAAVLLGLLNTAVAFVGFVTPAVVGYLTYQNQTTPQWQRVFWISSVWLFLSGLLYIFVAKSELQPWNSPEKQKIPEEELMVIKSERVMEKQ